MAFYSELPKELVDDVGRNRCILFIGAGVSKKCLGKGRLPLPNWKEFLQAFCRWQFDHGSISESTADEIESLLSRGKYLMVAEELVETTTEDEFARFLNTTFEPALIVPSILHSLVVALPFRAILTSNYDNLIEQAFYSAFKTWPKVLNYRDIGPGLDVLGNDFFLLKIHGDIGDPRSIVLGHKSYANLLYNSQEYREFLERVFCEYAILFIGYGGSDPDIDAIYDKLLATKPTGHRIHYMLSLKGSMTETEKKRLLCDRKIKVIEYVDYFGLHNHVDTFLFDIATELTKSGAKLKGPLPQKFRSRAYVAYDQVDTTDGRFVRDCIFKLGAITTGKNEDTYPDFVEKFDSMAGYLDVLLVFVGETKLEAHEPFYRALIKNAALCTERKVPVILIAHENQKQHIEGEFPQYPRFFVPSNFIEKDLSGLGAYLLDSIRPRGKNIA